MTTLTHTSRRRLRANRAVTILLTFATAIALVPLALIVYYLLTHGVAALSSDFFTTDPNGNFLGYPGGIKSALFGTLEIVALASALSIPAGIGVAVYLVEYGRDNITSRAVRFFIDVMTGVPSIVFGLFVYIVLVLAHTGGSSFAGWKGSIALALLMLPVVTRSAEVVLALVPNALREAALALGAPRWRTILRIVLPTALPGLVTGVLLAVARAAGETAPLLFTAGIAQATTSNANAPMDSLPALIFADIGAAQQRAVDRAWGAALTLVTLVLVLNLLARAFARRSRLA
jgi:phosphate transport system permease protein